MDSRQPGLTPADAGKAEKRTPRSIRFYDPEWERIESFADKRGVAAAEFVRFAALAAIEDGSGALSDPAPRGRLAPLIEMTFRAAYMLATKNARRDARRGPQGRAGRAGRRRPRAAGRVAGRRIGLKIPASRPAIEPRLPSGSRPEGAAAAGPVPHSRPWPFPRARHSWSNGPGTEPARRAGRRSGNHERARRAHPNRAAGT